MEKSTASALLIAGAGVLTACMQVFVFRAVKRKRAATEEEKKANSAEATKDA